MTFREFLMLERGGTSGKTGLYPLGYGGIGLYPPQDFITKSADALYYMDQDDRLYKGKEGPPHDIRHIPGRPSSLKTTTGEGWPFKISHIKK